MGAGNPQAVLSALTDTSHRMQHAMRDLSVLADDLEELIQRARDLGIAEHVIQNHINGS